MEIRGSDLYSRISICNLRCGSFYIKHRVNNKKYILWNTLRSLLFQQICSVYLQFDLKDRSDFHKLLTIATNQAIEYMTLTHAYIQFEVFHLF